MTNHDAPGSGAPEPYPRLGLRRDSTLKLISSPVDHKTQERAEAMDLRARTQSDTELLGAQRNIHGTPEFVKHHATTIYELLFDLWFVANLEVFASSKSINKETDLFSYIGYLSILWFTWFLVSLFDARFGTDGLFERVIRTAHLGVMVGFSVVVSYFDPSNQRRGPFRTLSMIIMLSRLVLCIQYGTVIWHIRRYQKGSVPLALAIAVHFIAAMIYLGISFRFEEGRNSRVYIVWYIVAACEALLQSGLARYYKVLTFTGTHLTERMTVVTVVMLGSGGVTNIAKNVMLIVSNDSGWTPSTVGVLIAAVTLTYCFFQIYFDWMDHDHLKGWRQLTWTMFHFPFHVALLLFMEGSTQFMIWWKAHEIEIYAANVFETTIERLGEPNITITSQFVADEVNKTITGIFELYPPKYTLTMDRINDMLLNISGMPQWLWNSNDTDLYDAQQAIIINDTTELVYSVVNSLFATFEIDPFEDMEETDPTKMQAAALLDINERFRVVFQYSYITAGLVLMMMVVMYAIAKRRGWTPFVTFRTVLFLLMGLGLALVDLTTKNEATTENYLYTPWPLPTICIVFFTVLALTHLPHPPSPFSLRRRRGAKPGGKRGGGGGGGILVGGSGDGAYNGSYSSVQVREVGPHDGDMGHVTYDTQGYNPHRWGNGDTSHHGMYGHVHEYGAVPSEKHL